MNAL
jgi:hypothetical protein